MRKLVVLAGLVGLVAPSAFGATIDFGPAGQITAVGGNAPVGSTHTFDVTLNATGVSFNELAALRVFFQSTDLGITAPVGGGGFVGGGGTFNDDGPPATALGSGYQPDGMIGVPAFIPASSSGFIGNFSTVIIDLTAPPGAGEIAGRFLNVDHSLVLAGPNFTADALGHTPYNFATDVQGFQPLIGHLTVDASGLAVGSYDVVVIQDPNNKIVGVGAGEFENISGFGTVNVVVPEPATLALLGLGGIAALRRRKKA